MNGCQVARYFRSMALLALTTGLALVKVEAATVRIDFTGTVFADVVSQGIGDLITGSIKFDQTDVVDSDPDPGVGRYSILLTDSSSLNVGGEQISLSTVSSIITVKDNSGCDCFFLDIPLDQEVGGVHTSRFLINIQNEFGPDAFTMFSDDSLPTSTFPFPNAEPLSTYARLQFYDRTSRTELIRDATIDTFSISSVPEASAIWLFGSGLIGLIGMMKIRSMEFTC